MLWVSLSKSILDRSWQFRPLPAEFQFFSVSKKVVFGWSTNAQNPHTWGTFHNIFEALLRCFKCVQVESLKKHQNRCEFRHPQLWGFWTISRPPKNHFFWNRKKIEIRPGVAGTVRNGPESIWKGSSNCAPGMIFDKNMADQNRGGYF